MRRLLNRLMFWRRKCSGCGCRTGIYFSGSGIGPVCPSCWFKRHAESVPSGMIGGRSTPAITPQQKESL